MAVAGAGDKTSAVRQVNNSGAVSGSAVPGGASAAALVLTVFDGGERVLEVGLSQLRKNTLTFGRAEDNDIVIPSVTKVVSRHHGVFEFVDGGWVIRDEGSTNGIMVNGVLRQVASLSPGDIVSIGRLDSADDCAILMCGQPGIQWSNVVLDRRRETTIGRLGDNDIVLPSPVVSGHHAVIMPDDQGSFYLRDLQSYNGTYVMGRQVPDVQLMRPGDIISIAMTPMVFTGATLLYCTQRRGVDVMANDLVKIRKTRKGERTTTDHISLHIKRGDFVAIVGGSGSGKSTLLNELNGSDQASSGTVLVDGIDLYANYGMLKNAIGYVPQQDIVFDDLTLIDMLCYAAELRMPPDSSKEERIKRANEVIDLLELSGERDSYIRQLSGGQKKRASIAVELLADPRLLFLDEPTSGLDPGIEQDLMRKLAAMAQDGRTIILVTHTTLNLHLCSQVVFLGPGGKLCYAGPPTDAPAFFGVDDYVPVYDKIAQDPQHWANRFEAHRGEISMEAPAIERQIAPKAAPSFAKQLSTLTRRYLKLIVNDRQRLLLLLLQAPVLAALISVVAGNECFLVCEKTTSCLFALSCAAFWVGILNSIQEICKERVITKREYAGGLRLSAYVLSKVIVLGVLCVVQALMLTVVFLALSKNELNTDSALIISSGFEMFVTMLLITLSAMCLGLWVSALSSNPDRAIAVAPILIMPQVLFSGVVFKLEGIGKTISAFVNCKWGMEALGTTANVNALPLKIYGEEVTVPASTQHIDEATVLVPETSTEYMGQSITIDAEERTLTDFDVDVPEQSRIIDESMLNHDPEDAYLYSAMHLFGDWGVLLLFCVVCVALCGFSLKRTIQR